MNQWIAHALLVGSYASITAVLLAGGVVALLAAGASATRVPSTADDLLLLVVGTAIVGVAYLAHLPWTWIGTVASWLVLAATAGRLLWSRRSPRAVGVMPAATGLTALGATMLERVAPGLGTQHLAFGSLGIVAAVLIARRSDCSHWCRGPASIAAVAASIVLAANWLPKVGRVINGARIALDLGFVEVQPAEVARWLLLGWVAAHLVSWHHDISRPTILRHGVPQLRLTAVRPLAGAALVAAAAQVAAHDVGPALVTVAVLAAMIWWVSGRLRILVITAAALAGAWMAASVLAPHAAARLAGWRDHPSGQVLLAGSAFARGGWFGAGPGRGAPSVIPYVETDGIAALWAEELGLLGLVAYFMLLGAVFLAAVAAVNRRTEPTMGLWALGTVTALTIGALVHLGGLVRIVPLTGLPLPFASSGGTSLILAWASVGLVVAAVRRSR